MTAASMLSPTSAMCTELHRAIVLGGLRSRSEGAAHHHRLVVEDLCHDRLATGLRTGACAHHQRDDKAAKPEHFEPHLDRAEGGGGGLDRLAGVRARDVGYLHFLSLIHISEPTRLGMISYAVFC